MDDLITEDDLKTFEGFLRCQAIDLASLNAADVEMWKGIIRGDVPQSGYADPTD